MEIATKVREALVLILFVAVIFGVIIVTALYSHSHIELIRDNSTIGNSTEGTAP